MDSLELISRITDIRNNKDLKQADTVKKKQRATRSFPLKTSGG